MGGIGSGKPPRVEPARVVGLAREHPEYTYAEIGRMVGGITRERVRQILAEDGSFKKHAVKCFFCRGSIPRNKLRYADIQFQGDGPATRKSVYQCAACALRRKREIKKNRLITLFCDQCGRFFTKSDSALRKGKFRGYYHSWCSEKCRVEWFEAHRRKTNGKPLDAVVSVKRAERMRRAARTQLLTILEPQKVKISHALADRVANEAKHVTRKARRSR